MTEHVAEQLAEALLRRLGIDPGAPVSTRQRRARGGGCGRPLGDASMVSADDISRETGHSAQAILDTLLQHKSVVEHTRYRHGRSGTGYRWHWGQARAVVIRALGGGGLPGRAEGKLGRHGSAARVAHVAGHLAVGALAGIVEIVSLGL